MAARVSDDCPWVSMQVEARPHEFSNRNLSSIFWASAALRGDATGRLWESLEQRLLAVLGSDAAATFTANDFRKIRNGLLVQGSTEEPDVLVLAASTLLREPEEDGGIA